MDHTTFNKNRWPEVEPIFDRALDLGLDRATIEAPETVDQFLAAECGDDSELREQVVALLVAAANSGRFLETPAAEFAAPLIEEFEEVDEVPETPAGQMFGPYRLSERIGRGGMGEVFEAVDTRLDRTVALKILSGFDLDLLAETGSSSKGAGDLNSKDRFLREARAASALDHPNVCTVHDIGETDDGRLFIVMARYRGSTLQDRLAAGVPAPAEALEITRQVLSGLDAAHRIGIVHRDIKPANLFLTDAGVVKILDFGVAKILGADGSTRTGTAPGTPSYMAPEQIRGETLDGRSDLWALGVVCYEMLTGRRPFEGEQAATVIHGILQSEPESLRDQVAGLDPSLAEALDRMLAKRPADRPKDAVVAARSLGFTLGGSASWSAVRGPEAQQDNAKTLRLRRAAIVLGAFVGLGLLAFGLWRVQAPSIGGVEATQQERDKLGVASAAAATDRRATGVLFFRNLAGRDDLDWLETGVAEMINANLSQNPRLDVRSSGEVGKALSGLELNADQALTEDASEQIRASLGADTLIEGSFAEVGGLLRIAFRVDDPDSGKPLVSETVDGSLDSELFSMIDRVTSTLLAALDSDAPGAPEVSLADLTSASLDAWRFYAQALDLQRQTRRQEAVAAMEKAVAEDPSFAIALADLSLLYGNLGDLERSRELGRRALEHADRLPIDQRLWIEGTYYSAEWDSYGRALAVYEEAAALHPERHAIRDNLGAQLGFYERFEEAAEVYGQLIEDGTDYAGTYASAAFVNVGLGRFAKARGLIEEYFDTYPESGYLRYVLAWIAIERGQLESAAETLDRAEVLMPGDRSIAVERWRLAALDGRWADAARIAEGLLDEASSYRSWTGQLLLAVGELYRGDFERASDHLDEAFNAYEDPGPFSALALCLRAEVELALGRADRALVSSETAISLGRAQWPAVRGRFLAALALETLGRSAEADALTAELKRRLGEAPNRVEERQLHHLEGRLALLRGEPRRALASLRRAEELLAPHPIDFHWHAQPDAAEIWFALGEAERTVGNDLQARRWFALIKTRGTAGLRKPVEMLLSLDRLAKIDRSPGKLSSASDLDDRLAEHWDADLLAEISDASFP